MTSPALLYGLECVPLPTIAAESAFACAGGASDVVWPLGRRGINIISECARPKILFGWVVANDGCGYARDISGTHSPVQSLFSDSLGSELLSLRTQAQLRDRAPLLLVAVEHHHIGPTYSLANHHPAHTVSVFLCPCLLLLLLLLIACGPCRLLAHSL